MPAAASADRDPVGHYDAAYFARQSAHVALRGEANRFKFAPFARPGDRIVDFGCGDGSLLTALGGSVGVEINPHAAAAARAKGLRVELGLLDLADASADLVVSNHALEHVEDPLGTLREMHRVLAAGGRAVLVVPCDRPRVRFREDDPDFHLFSWSASNLGNLARAAGFRVTCAEEIVHAWPPGWATVQRLLGWPGFHLASRIWGRLHRARSQVRLVAERP